MNPAETIRINAQGQITLPEATRRRFGWETDTRLEVIERDEQIILQKAGDEETPFKRWLRQTAGSADSGLRTDQIMEMTRGEEE